MVGKNNRVRMERSNVTKRYKAYKTGKGWAVASIASLSLSTLFLLGGLNETAFADDGVTSSNTSEDSAKAATAPTQAKEIALKSTTSATASSASDSAASASDETSETKTSAATETSSSSSTPTAAEKSGTTTTKPSSTSKTVGTSSSETKSPSTATPGTTVSPTATNVDDTKTTPTSTQTDGTTTNKSTTESSVTTAKTAQESLTSERKTTPTTVTAAKFSLKQSLARSVAPVAADTTTTESTATITLDSGSTNVVGYGGTTANNQVEMTINVTNVKANDVIVITIPRTSVLSYKSIAGLLPNQGTTKFNADKTILTETMSKDQNPDQFEQKLILTTDSNYTSKSTPITDIGQTYPVLSITSNGKQLSSITFKQNVQPNVKLSDVTRVHPNTSEKTIKANTDYIYSFSVQEANGVRDQAYASAQVNSAVNYGTVITIPVPTGFTLNSDLTNRLNDFNDKTAITQPKGAGGDILITVPKGSGKQGYQGASGYQFAGAFDVDQPATDEVLNAGNLMFDQKLNDDGTMKLTVTGNTFTEQLSGSDSLALTTEKIDALPVSGNSSADAYHLILDIDPTNDPTYLASYGFTTNLAGALTNGINFKIMVPDGVKFSGLTTPSTTISATQYLPNTTAYTYQITYRDGTVEKGSVVAGATIVASDQTKQVASINLIPNYLAAGAYTENKAFSLMGTLLSTYSSGKKVEIGDEFKFSNQISYVSNPGIIKERTNTQTVDNPKAYLISFAYQSSATPGNETAGQLRLAPTGNWTHTTYYIFEPTFYYVLPKAAHYVSFDSTQADVVNKAKISEFTADDGRTVVKIDFSDTGMYIDTNATQNIRVNLGNNIDALSGTYPFLMYVYSPETKLAQTELVTDTSYTDGEANAVKFGGGDWTISVASTLSQFSFAQGNQDTIEASAGSADDRGSDVVNFYTNIVSSYQSNTPAQIASLINLPTIGDSENSEYTFELSGPITLPSTYTTGDGQSSTAIDSTVLYSTELQAVTSGQSVSLTGYVTADQVTDWSKIRSIVIQINNLNNLSATGRIKIAGTIANFKYSANKVGYLQTNLIINNQASATRKTTLTVTGTSTVTARFHYVDDNGQDQYIKLADLTQAGLNNNVDTLKAIYPESLADFSDTDQALIPTNYALRSAAYHYVTSAEKPTEVGQTVTYDTDGEIIQYELTRQAGLTISYVDDMNDGQQVATDTVKGYLDDTGSYQVEIPDNLSNYQLADEQATSLPYKLTIDDSDNLTVHLVHQKKTESVTTTRTIKYVVEEGLKLTPPAPVTQTMTWNVETDLVTNEITATPGGKEYAAVDSPTFKGYQSDLAQVDALTTTEITEQPKNSADVTVTYSGINRTIKVEYVDDDDQNKKVVGSEPDLAGETDGTVNWNVTKVPTNYQLASNQATSGSYTVTTADNQVIQIHVVHQKTTESVTTTRSIKYVVKEGLKLTPPASVTQTMTWNVETDLVTKKITATPGGKEYAAVDSPTFKGYQADLAQVDALATVEINEQPKNQADVTVTYSGIKRTIKVEYVDDDDQNKKVVDTESGLAGWTDGTVNWNVTKVPTNYQLAPNQATSGSYTVTTAANQVIQIHLVHQLELSHPTSTRTINYVVTGHPDLVAPQQVVQTVTWDVKTDLITSEVVTATPNSIYAEIESPEVKGYTPDSTTVAEQTPASMDEALITTVTYTADEHKVMVEYIDDDRQGQVVNSVELSGHTDVELKWQADQTPTYYLLAATQAASGSYMVTAEKNQVIAIHLVHQVDTTTVITHRTIKYEVTNNKNLTLKSVVQSVTWDVKTDRATPQITATPVDKEYAAVDSPEVMGYTPSQAQVAALGVQEETAVPADVADVLVTYDGINQKATIQYVDDDRNGLVVKDTDLLDGKTGDQTTWNTQKKPDGYLLAQDQASSGSYTFTALADQVIEVHLVHQVDTTTIITHRTIKYEVANNQSLKPKSVVQSVTWDVKTDRATPQITATPVDKEYAAVDSPEVMGYTPSQAQVAALGVQEETAVPVDAADVLVTYDGIKQKATIQYVDDARNGLVVKDTDLLNGKTGDQTTWNTQEKPDGYLLAQGQASSGNYTFTASANQVIKIHLVHEIVKTTQSTSRTINYVVTGKPNLNPEQVVQKVTWQVVKDLALKTATATTTEVYAAVDSPAVNGYTPKPTTVAEQTPASMDEALSTTVTYTADGQTVTVEYIDDNGKGQVVNSVELVSHTDAELDWQADQTPTNYSLAATQAASGTYLVTAADHQVIQIHVVHQVETATVTTTRTIKYQVTANESLAPDSVEQIVTWQVVKDLALNTSTATTTEVYAAVASPEIKGYTPNLSEVTQQNPTATNETVTVTYQADNQRVLFEYLDQDQPVGKAKWLPGITDQIINWDTLDLPTNYQLAPDQAASGSYQLKAADNEAIQVRLVHQLALSHPTSTRTINYVVTGHANLSPQSVVQTVLWNVETDLVTKEVVTKTPTSVYTETGSPEVKGYTPDSTTVAEQTPASMDEALITTVTYTADEHKVMVEYIDDDRQGQVVNSVELSGHTDAELKWQADQTPTYYLLAATQAASGSYMVTAEKDQVIKVHLVHQIDATTVTTYRKINYEVVNNQSLTPKAVVQNVLWNVETDLVTKQVTATPTGTYATQASPVIAGYTANQVQVAELQPDSMTAMPTDPNVVTVTYQADPQTVSVEYVDDDQAGKVIRVGTALAGFTGETVSWTTDEKPANYLLADHQATTGNYQLTAAPQQVIQIHLVHQLAKSTVTTTRTIKYVVTTNTHLNPQPVVQTVTWQVIKDLAAGTLTATPNATYAQVTSPVMTGYQPDQAVVGALNLSSMTTIPGNAADVLIHYAGTKQRVTIQYVDDDLNGKTVGTPQDLVGVTDAQVTWHANQVPANYALATDQAASGQYQLTTAADQAVQIHLVHQRTSTTATTSRTINYVVSNAANLNPKSVVQTVTWHVVTDQVLKTSVATPLIGYAAVDSPTIAGYTADLKQVATFDPKPTDKPANAADVTVTYVGQPQRVTLAYVDDNQAGQLIKTGAVLTGITGGKISWQAHQPAVGYTFAPGQLSQGAYQLTAAKNQVITIHLIHQIAQTTKVTTRTINYVVTGNAALAPAIVKQTVTWHLTTDLALNKTVATPTGSYAAVTAPVISGYQADITDVAAVTPVELTQLPEDAPTITVVYTGIQQRVVIQYVDDDRNGQVVGTTAHRKGIVGTSTPWTTADKPTGYLLSAGQDASGTYEFTTAANQVVQIHLVHQLVRTTATTTRKVRYVVAGTAALTPRAVLQTVRWNVVTDQVTKTSTATPLTSYAQVNVPVITGYTPDKQVVTALRPIRPVDADEVVVTYHADPQQVALIYVDDDQQATPVGGVLSLKGATNQVITWNTTDKPANYQLAANQAATGQYQFTATDNQVIVIHLVHQFSTQTATTQRQVTYVVSNKPELAPRKVVQTVTWNVVTDQVTGKHTATALSGYGEILTPKVTGYTPDCNQIAAIDRTTTGELPALITETVTYHGDSQQVQLQYVDDDRAELQVGAPVVWTGHTGELAHWDTLTRPTGYLLAADQASQGSYEYTAATTQVITVHLVHQLQVTASQTTRTINYVLPSGTGLVLPATVQTVNWQTVTDLVTHVATTAAQNGLAAVAVPQVAGYTPSQTEIAAMSVAEINQHGVQNLTVLITYAANTKVPTKPVTPVKPSVPTKPVTPVKPSVPTKPVTPEQPNGPLKPAIPVQPNVPSQPESPTKPARTAKSVPPMQPTSADPVQLQRTTTAKRGTQLPLKQATKLPQTDEQSRGNWALIGEALLGLLALVGIKRKKRQD